ncbi:MAG: hypothetical protein OSJ63_07705 [Bacilli bacterium]|nr:hypothetical protein [Bacilli bacterium]
MNEEVQVSIDYEAEYKKLLQRMDCQLFNQKNKYEEILEKERNTNKLIIEELDKRVDFYEKIIKGILHIKD